MLLRQLTQEPGSLYLFIKKYIFYFIYTQKTFTEKFCSKNCIWCFLQKTMNYCVIYYDKMVQGHSQKYLCDTSRSEHWFIMSVLPHVLLWWLSVHSGIVQVNVQHSYCGNTFIWRVIVNVQHSLFEWTYFKLYYFCFVEHLYYVKQNVKVLCLMFCLFSILNVLCQQANDKWIGGKNAPNLIFSLEFILWTSLIIF